MAGVSETIVREYFELHGLFVRQQRKYIAPNAREEEEIDFWVINPNPQTREQPRPFLLEPSDLAQLTRAIVVVKPWHRETFSLTFLTKNPEIFHFLEPAVFEPAARVMCGSGTLDKILVVPALPTTVEARAQSVEFLRHKGINGVISFHTILADLIIQVEANRNYQKSDLLQTIRIFKNYDFFKEPQMELFKARLKRRPPPAPAGA